MKIYNKEKTKMLENPDLTKGFLRQDRIVVDIIPASEEVQEQFHYEYINYDNGGRDAIKIVDVEYRPAQEEIKQYEQIFIYIPFQDEEATEYLREFRERECFEIVNRGKLWYNLLTNQQFEELDEWYQAWLDVTETREVPTKPSWLEGK